MRIVFSRSQRWFSTLICAVTKERFSHVSIDLGDGTILQSNFRGVHLSTLDNFIEAQQEVHYIKVPKVQEIQLRENIKKILDKYEHSWYDLGAMLFLGFALILRRYLHISLPKSNLWQTTGMFLCTELVTKILGKEERSMITPYRLYEELKGKGL